jgi:hypothetical protein
MEVDKIALSALAEAQKALLAIETLANMVLDKEQIKEFDEKWRENVSTLISQK